MYEWGVSAGLLSLLVSTGFVFVLELDHLVLKAIVL